MNSELILFCASIRDVDVDVTDNDFKLAFPDFHRCKSVKVIAKAPDTSQNPRREGGPERGIIPEPTRGRFNLKDLPRVDFNFGPPRTPLLETFPIRNR
jgi:ABC-type antimicrobial peptide transport system ATPase subunit